LLLSSSLVRCGAGHQSSVCPNPRDDPPKYANFSENHPVGYNGYSIYRELQQKKNQLQKVILLLIILVIRLQMYEVATHQMTLYPLNIYFPINPKPKLISHLTNLIITHFPLIIYNYSRNISKNKILTLFYCHIWLYGYYTYTKLGLSLLMMFIGIHNIIIIIIEVHFQFWKI